MRSILLLALLVPGAAVADCPTRDALAEGQPAHVSYPDGSVVDLVWIADGLVQETTRYGDGEGEFRMISRGGVFIVDEVDMADDREVEHSRIITTYPKELEARLPVGPHQEFALTAVNSFADGTEPEEERIEIRTGGLAEIDIAGCLYEGFPMLLIYRWQEEYFTSMMTHIPELGLSLELARMDQDMPAEPFAPIRFELRLP